MSCGVEIPSAPLASKKKSGNLWEGRDVYDLCPALHSRAGDVEGQFLIPNSK